jgi:class 3 adenylate cyclase/tetratricopeptide (TPR) repeat protein
MAACPHCGADNREGAKFCADCGTPVGLACPACGAPGSPGQKFCDECGTPFGGRSAASSQPREAPSAERRIVSVLFADLVGFTPLSESRDPEEVRELLSRYFETCRRLVELYGGVVEKFIGDAVMAVWGTPVAQEDDAERAVRVALDLVAAVSALGDEVGAPELRARAGVLTGEAAVNLAATGEGMVAGDLVNTAARLQATAEPGSVLVGEATRRASEHAVVFEDAGEHVLKGKADAVQLWRAVRVNAARGGALRSEGLEAPFVGRERELRLVKELFHASAEQSRAQLVQITGIAGIGKSRLAWEFFKYLDGLKEQIWWHRGRCLAYGEGVAYWALAEMVRMRAQILEGEDQDTAREKLAACLELHVPDPEERAWIGPRLANLLGLEEREDTDRQDLFAAWRLFFERLADKSACVLVLEDLQWADQALLAFVEYLLEWSSSQRLYVIALARPELAEQNPDFGRAVRNSTSLGLEPLSPDDMTRLLDGYVPGLPEQLKGQTLARAQGVPLYAVETVRMLLDRGLLARDGAVYSPTGEIGTLEIPDTLHALAAARLDGLPAEERQLVQQACVLGKTFSKQALAALTGMGVDELEPLLAALVRKEVFSLQADPRWPERGQYGFLQELLRQVAYETLSRHDRKVRHLAAVDALEQTFQGADQEVPEVIAAHLLAAADAQPDAPDVPEIRLRARAALLNAGERAAALAAPEEAMQHLDRAAELAGDDPEAEAELLSRAGALAYLAGNTANATERLQRALDLHDAQGNTVAAMRARVSLAEVEQAEGRFEDATRRFEEVMPVLEAGGPSAELAAALAGLGGLWALRGDLEAAGPLLERALQLAESLSLDEVLIRALTRKAVVLLHSGRRAEARLLLEGAQALARERELHSAWMRAGNNLGAVLETDELHVEVIALTEEMAAQARQRGDRERLVASILGPIPSLLALGRWDEALERGAEVEQLQSSPWARAELVNLASILCERGELPAAEALLAAENRLREADNPELQTSFTAVDAKLLLVRDRPAEALAAAESGLAHRAELGMSKGVKACLIIALEAALELDDLARADELLSLIDSLPPGDLTPSLEGQRARFHARVYARRGEQERVERSFRIAARVFAEHNLVFNHAVVQLEHAEWLVALGRADDAQVMYTRARETFEELGAAPWLARVDLAQPAARAGVPA